MVISEIVSAIIQCIGIYIGARTVVYQLNQQHKIDLDLQRAESEKELKIKFFEGLSERNLDAQKAALEIQSAIRSLPGSYRNYLYSRDVIKLNPTAIPERVNIFAEKFQNYSQSIIDIIGYLEMNEIFQPEFKVFRLIFSEQLRIDNQAFYSFYNKILPFLPVDIPQDKIKDGIPSIIFPNVPCEKLIQEIESNGNHFIENTLDTIGFLFDLNVEAQNKVLGNIFKGKVQRRVPEDPKVHVISLDPEFQEINKLTLIHLQNTK